MNPLQAANAAIGYVSNLFGGDQLVNLGLEEIETPAKSGTWKITIGFSRPWNTVRGALSTITGELAPRRAFRVVEMDENGQLLGVTRRDIVSD